MTTQKLLLRESDPAERSAVSSLLQSVGLPLEGFEEHFPNFLLAQVDGQLVGCAGLEVYGEHGLLRSVAVAPDRRHEGAGSQLVGAMLAVARRRRLKTVTLLTETAAAYFPRFGFVAIARGDVPCAVRASAEFQGACPDSAVAMILTLAAEAV